LIAADPDFFFWARHPGSGPKPPGIFAPEAAADYLRCYRNPATVHAICEDYRAAATVDFAHDMADRGRRKIACPLLALWGRRGRINEWYDVLAVWRDWASDVRGGAVDSGHFLAEEAPDETYAALRDFFAG
jgi:haloacetate dehalogenase